MQQLVISFSNQRAVRFAAWFSTCLPLVASAVLSGAVLAVAAVCYPIAGLIDEHFGKWITLPSFEFRRWPFVVLALVICPLLETLFNQLLVFKVAYLSKRFRQHRWMVVVVSGLLFGSHHFYSAGYIFLTTCVGMVFAAGFLLSATYWRAFWVVSAARCAANLVGLAIKW